MNIMDRLVKTVVLAALVLAAYPARAAGPEAPRGSSVSPRSGPGVIEIVPAGFRGPRWSVGFGWGWPYPAWGWYGPPPPPYVYARPIPRDASFIELHVHPWKAAIRIDGHEVGRAKDYNSEYNPLVIRSGRHLLEISYPDHMTYRTRIDAAPGGYYVLRHRLEEGRGIDPRSNGESGEPRPPQRG